MRIVRVGTEAESYRLTEADLPADRDTFPAEV